MEWITEQERRLRVAHDCDVLVAGGGVAGIAAALAAARNGARVTLVEKQCLLGGLGTLGLVTIYLPLCDGMGRQVSFGIAEELHAKLGDRFAPPPMLRRLVDEGHLGRKTGRGFYEWSEQ